MRRLLAQSYAFSTLTLAANLINGIVTARALGPSGRGEAIAIAMLAINLGMLAACGAGQATSYRFAREPGAGARLLTAWLAILGVLSLVAFGIGQLALPVLFDAQSADAIALARIYLVTIVLVLLSTLTNGMLLGSEDYLFVNAARLAQPAIVAVVQIVLWALDSLTVESTLITAAASTVLVQAAAVRRVLARTGGFGPFDRKLARETLSYGFRGQGAVLAGTLNQRLDLLILPAFVAAASIGLYSVAANVSLIVYTVSQSFSAILLPAAVRRGVKGPATVQRSLRAIGGLALVAAFALFVVARPALELVYGEDFGEAATALRLLLPGTVLLAAASVLLAGLYAAGRPGLSTLAQITGLVITVAGLLVFVPDGGIEAAAIVSTAAYGAVFVAALLAYRRAAELTWRSFVNPSSSAGKTP